jgi:hypothetical protein
MAPTNRSISSSENDDSGMTALYRFAPLNGTLWHVSFHLVSRFRDASENFSAGTKDRQSSPEDIAIPGNLFNLAIEILAAMKQIISCRLQKTKRVCLI